MQPPQTAIRSLIIIDCHREKQTGQLVSQIFVPWLKKKQVDANVLHQHPILSGIDHWPHQSCACQPKRLALGDALATLIQIGVTVGRRAVRMRADATRAEMQRVRRSAMPVSQQAPLPVSPQLPSSAPSASGSASASATAARTSTSQAGHLITRLQPLPTGTIAGLSPYWFAAHDGPVLSTAPDVLLLLASKNATLSSSPADALARLRAAEISIFNRHGERPFVADAGFLLRAPPPLAEV